MPGEYRLTLEAEPQAGELVLTNNRVSTFVNVLKGGLSVLYLEGTLRPEISKLRRSLEGSPDMKVDYYFIDPRNVDKTRPANMAEMFKPGKHDVYILGDLDSSVFEGTELADLAESVRKGAGLIMLGGLHSFGPGGYAETPLNAVLPVEMHRLDRQALDAEPRKDVQIDRPTRMVPTPLVRGPDGFAMRIVGHSPGNRGALVPVAAFGWREHSPVQAGRQSAGRNGDQESVVDLSELRRRPSHGLCGRLHGAMVDARLRGGAQAILAPGGPMVSQERRIHGRKRVDQDRPAPLSPGQPVEFTMGAQATSGEAIKNATYHVEIEMPGGGRQAVSPVRGPDQTSASFRDTQKAGDYTIHLTAEDNGRQVGSTRARFLVFEQDLELDNATADATVPESLASMTGGKTLTPEELPGLVRKLSQDTAALEVEIEAKLTPWDTWPFFLVMIGLMVAEWWLRKKWGLV